MGLSNVLGTAMSGLHVTQSSIETVSQNIANANTDGYTRKIHRQTDLSSSGSTYVRSQEATRALDRTLERAVRTESAALADIDAQNDLQAQLSLLFGQPGSEIALDNMYNDVVEALNALVTSPESTGARQNVLTEASALAARLNQLSDGVQELRRQAEVGLAEGVREANAALQEIGRLDRQIVLETGSNRGVDADLLDQRDRAVAALNELVGVETQEKNSGGVMVMTSAGVVLYDHTPSVMAFDGSRSVTAQQLYSRDGNERGVGTITVGLPDGAKLDLLSFEGMRSGRLHGYVEMRDNALVDAQAQLDELAHGLAKATARSSIDNAGTATAPSYDAGQLNAGDVIEATYQVGAETRTLRLVQSGAVVPETYTADPRDIVVGVDMSAAGGATAGSINTAIQNAISNRLTAEGATAAQVTAAQANAVEVTAFTAGGAVVLGATGTAAVTASRADRTETDATVSALGTGVPLFNDGGANYLDAPVFGGNQQRLGFAGRITVNQDVIDAPSRLVKMTPGTASGDPARPQALLDALDTNDLTFRAAGGVGGPADPFKGSPSDYVRAIISSQGAKSAAIAQAADSQDLVTNSLVERAERVSGVDIEEEMADLLDLQNIYNANSQVVKVVQELMDQLFASVR